MLSCLCGRCCCCCTCVCVCVCLFGPVCQEATEQTVLIPSYCSAWSLQSQIAVCSGERWNPVTLNKKIIDDVTTMANEFIRKVLHMCLVHLVQFNSLSMLGFLRADSPSSHLIPAVFEKTSALQMSLSKALNLAATLGCTLDFWRICE